MTLMMPRATSILAPSNDSTTSPEGAISSTWFVSASIAAGPFSTIRSQLFRSSLVIARNRASSVSNAFRSDVIPAAHQSWRSCARRR